jgi:putative hydrolase of the HAD superfamily
MQYNNLHIERMKKYRYLFFDLDRTLWDYETNASEALLETFELFDLRRIFQSFRDYRDSFTKYNDVLWSEYREGNIQKDLLRVRRFELVLQEQGMNDTPLASKLNAHFLSVSPNKTTLVPGTIEVLEYLKYKGYRLYILTNGFTQIQEVKMSASGLNPYFEKMFTCENTFSFKPKREFFEYAVTSINAKKADVVMVGDDLAVDIVGAREYGLDQIYFNPNGILHSQKVTHEIRELREMMSIV